MTETPTLLTLSGSLRKDSFNRKLLAAAANAFGPATVVEADLALPLYDGDLEAAEGLPDAVVVLADQIASADAVLISSPEYNKGISGVLKNALDWVSRDKRRVFADKPLAVMTAAAGRGGGETAQVMLRACVTPLGPKLISGPVVAVASAGSEFASGTLENTRYLDAIATLMQKLRAEI